MLHCIELIVWMYKLSALTYEGTVDDTTINPYPFTRAMLTTVNYWSEVIIKYDKTRTNKSDKPKMMSCLQSKTSNFEFWKDGQALYKYDC